MAEVKVSALTALTGADVANGDELYIVDAGSPNVSKKITADQLAQMPQLSSRYKPLASDRLFITAAQFVPILASPSFGTSGNTGSSLNRTGALLFDDSTDEAASTTFVMPLGWATAEVFLWWTAATANAGDVLWEASSLALSSGGSTDSAGTRSSGATTAPAQYTLLRTSRVGVTATAGQFVRLMVRRYGGNVGDTLTGDAALHMVEVVRLT